MPTERHIFVTPQNVEPPVPQPGEEPTAVWVLERFCAVCGQYFAHEIHYRALEDAPKA
jgi:hypothetical protein